MTTSRWPIVRLGNVINPVSRPEAVQPEIIYKILGARWYAKGLYTKAVKPGSEIRASNVYRVQKGDFVYNRLFAWKGSFAVASDENDGCYVSNEFPCFQCQSEIIIPEYLHYYFSREIAWLEALGLSTGGTPTSRNRLKQERLLAMTIPLPPLAEQRRIVAKIDHLAAKIEEARGLRGLSVVEVEALLKSARRSCIGDVPEKDWVELQDVIVDIENGWSPACHSHPAPSGEWGVLKVGAVSFGIFDPTENKELPKELRPKIEYEIRPGDFLMSRANTLELVGACALVSNTPPRLILCDKIFRFVFQDDSQLIPAYLNHVMKSPALRMQIESAATGTSPTMKNISKAKILRLLIPTPPIPEQRRIVAYIDDLQAKVDALKKFQAQTAAELDALLPSILDQAFKGEL